MSKKQKVAHSVSHSVTRSPIELFWTAKNDHTMTVQISTNSYNTIRSPPIPSNSIQYHPLQANNINLVYCWQLTHPKVILGKKPFQPPYIQIFWDWAFMPVYTFDHLCLYTVFLLFIGSQELLQIIDADWFGLMMTDADWYWLMLIDADWCWLMLIDADWFLIDNNWY